MSSSDDPIDPVALTVMAVNRLGPAMFRAVSYGTEVLVTVPDLATCEIFRAALRETQKARTTDRLIRVEIAEPALSHGERIARYRTIFISDVHLGTRGCKASFLLDFLRWTDSDYLYLVGDVVDGWRLRKSWYWPQPHNDVVQKLLRKARKGTKLFYVPGNHDEWLRDFCDSQFGGIALVREAIHETADGRQLLVIHGDAFDGVVRYARWLAHLGDWAYDAAIEFNRLFNIARRRLGYPYWSLSAYLKLKVKNAVQFVSDYADAISAEAHRRGVDGIVCGHIHHAEISERDGVLYCNDGDWVESCTALVEHFDGRLEIVRWIELRELDPLEEILVPEDGDIEVEAAAG